MDRPPDDASLFSAHKQNSDGSSDTKRGVFGGVVRGAYPLILIAVLFVLVWLPNGLSWPARVSLFCFALAAILWSTTKLSAAFVALGTALLLVVAGGAKQKALFDALATDVIWLMIGTFILGGAVQQTGLAQRLTNAVVTARDGKPRTFSRICWLLTFLLLPLSLLIPSTSGRAAVVLPMFKSVTDAAGNAKVARVLALLIPAIILVSTCSTLIGASSHLITNDLLGQISGKRISFAQWATWGMPFGIVASAATCLAIQTLFLSPEDRAHTIDMKTVPREALSRDEKYVLTVLGMMVLLWATESVHGFKIATITVGGALVLTLPHWGVLDWKDGLEAVSWNLIVFVGAALVLGRALIETKVASWIVSSLFAASGLSKGDSPLVILAALAFLSLTAHLYMTSHAARAVALVPALLYLGQSLKLNPVAVAFIGTVGMDYCLTFPVSSKALLMFQELDGETFTPGDLLKLSALLIPVHFALILAFYYGYWRFTGLKL